MPQRLCVSGKKQAIFLAACCRFRLDDVRQTRDGNFHTVHNKVAAVVPDVFKLEAGHHEREVDAQPEASRLARIPCAHQIVRVGRQEEIAVLCGEHGTGGRREVVCACNADHGKADRTPAELTNETTKLVVHHLSALCALIVSTEVRLRAVHPALIRSGLILGKGFDLGDVIEIVLRKRHGSHLFGKLRKRVQNAERPLGVGVHGAILLR